LIFNIYKERRERTMAQNRKKVGYGYIGQSSYWKQDSNKPRYYGKITVNGQDLELAGWDKNKNGKKYVSIQISEIVEAGGVARDEEAPF